MSKSFLLSHLASRYAQAELAAFAQAFPHPWVVWEPGPWLPGGHASTQLVAHSDQLPRAGGEALAMALVVSPGRAAVVLGRSEQVDLPINDGTLSRSHLHFTRSALGIWSVEDPGSSNGSWVDGRKLEPHSPALLRDGAQVQAGQVYLTFQEPAGLLARLRRR